MNDPEVTMPRPATARCRCRCPCSLPLPLSLSLPLPLSLSRPVQHCRLFHGQSLSLGRPTSQRPRIGS